MTDYCRIIQTDRPSTRRNTAGMADAVGISDIYDIYAICDISGIEVINL